MTHHGNPRLKGTSKEEKKKNKDWQEVVVSNDQEQTTEALLPDLLGFCDPISLWVWE